MLIKAPNMDRKSVLVSYGERNKVVSIPQSTGKSDLEFLSKEFKTVFSFGDNVNLLLTFQKFDSEWGEYLDLEDNSTLFHKDKVNAIVRFIFLYLYLCFFSCLLYLGHPL